MGGLASCRRVGHGPAQARRTVRLVRPSDAHGIALPGGVVPLTRQTLPQVEASRVLASAAERSRKCAAVGAKTT
jgi:hypothetical protein